MVSPCYKIQRKRKKNIYNYPQKLIDDFKLIVVNPPLKLTDQENCSIATYFGYYSQYQGIEINTKRILNYDLEHWNEKKSSANPSKCALTSSETAALKMYSI